MSETGSDGGAATPQIPAAVRGAAWMLLAGLSYALTGALVRLVSDTYPMFELAFLRSVIAVLLMVPLIARLGPGALKTQQLGTHLIRATIGYIGILFWFYGVSAIPLGNYYALQFTMPLFTIAGAMLFLGERSGPKVWFAVAVGFAGALIILRPGLIEISLGAMAALGAAFSFAIVNVMVRVLSRKDPSSVLVVYANLLIIPLSLIPALIDWVTPRLADLPIIIGVGVMGTLAQYSITRAITAAPARIVQPFDFGRLPMAVAVGWVMFGEMIDGWTWLGAAVIFSAGYYVISQERRSSA